MGATFRIDALRQWVLWHPTFNNMKDVRIVGFGAQPQLRRGDCLGNPEDGGHRPIKIEFLEIALT